MNKIIVLLVLMISSISGYAQYAIGETVSDFSLKGVDGEMHSIKADGGSKASVIVFTCNHCPYAVLYEDRIIALQEKMKDRGVNIIAINPNDPAVRSDDSFDKMIERSDEKSFNFPYLFDEGQKVFPIWGAKRTPQVFLIDSNNVLQYMGAIDDNAKDPEGVEEKYLEKAIEAILNGDEITPTVTKAIGCSIKTQ